MSIRTYESRYRIANLLFRFRFGCAGEFKYLNFERHFGGFLINVALPIMPSKSREETLQSAITAAKKLQQWLHWTRRLFNSHDRIQLIVCFPEGVKSTKRQILKNLLPADVLYRVTQSANPLEYEKLGGVSHEMLGWWWDLFD